MLHLLIKVTFPVRAHLLQRYFDGSNFSSSMVIE